MKFVLLAFALLAICGTSSGGTSSSEPSPDIIPVPGGKTGWGTTTRYWDCCKPSCAWVENIKTKTMVPVETCSADGVTKVAPSVQSSCIGGKTYMCSKQQATVINSTLAYGFAAASFTGGADTNLCCACFLLNFQGKLSGKQMVVQVSNTGGDLGSNQFDLAIPGGGVGIFTQGCMSQWNTPWNGWGDQYGGVGSREQCSQLPIDLQPGCQYRFDFMENESNPQVSFVQVKCPSELVALTGCEL